jgi:hypothetical protein
MTRQQASAVVTVPLESLQQALRNVEDWTAFIAGVSKITKRAHERYVFELDEGGSPREVAAVVRLNHRDHCFTWHAVSGPRFDGCLKLTAVDGGRRTRVSIDLTAHPDGFVAGITDFVAHRRPHAVLDLQRLESYAARVSAGG